MAPRIAKSLAVLRDQIDAAYPGRSKTSDGWIATAQHTKQNPNSDHEKNESGVVQALDITHDPAHRLDAGRIAEALLASHDPRIKYVISNKRIAGSPEAVERKQVKGPPWAWHTYTGPNEHRLHFHVSVLDDPAKYDDQTPWNIGQTMAVTNEMRRRMAQIIVNYEAQRDDKGNIKVYQPPANDGGGAFEVAGINVANHPEKAAQLKKLIEDGKFQEAETAAGDYVLEYTNPAASWHDNPGVEFFLRDSFFNRGPKGAARILQRAVQVEDDGIVGSLTRAAIARFSPSQILSALRMAREDYERNVVGYRANFWNGLTNRWNKALADAQQFAQEEPPVLTWPTPDLPALPGQPSLPGLDLGPLLTQFGPLIAQVISFVFTSDNMTPEQRSQARMQLIQAAIPAVLALLTRPQQQTQQPAAPQLPVHQIGQLVGGLLPLASAFVPALGGASGVANIIGAVLQGFANQRR